MATFVFCYTPAQRTISQTKHLKQNPNRMHLIHILNSTYALKRDKEAEDPNRVCVNHKGLPEETQRRTRNTAASIAATCLLPALTASTGRGHCPAGSSPPNCAVRVCPARFAPHRASGARPRCRRLRGAVLPSGGAEPGPAAAAAALAEVARPGTGTGGRSGGLGAARGAAGGRHCSARCLAEKGAFAVSLPVAEGGTG